MASTAIKGKKTMYCFEDLEEKTKEARKLAKLHNTTVLLIGRRLLDQPMQTVIGYSVVGHLKQSRDEILEQEKKIWKKENQEVALVHFISN